MIINNKQMTTWGSCG